MSKLKSLLTIYYPKIAIALKKTVKKPATGCDDRLKSKKLELSF
jgi:hypothetical protein